MKILTQIFKIISYYNFPFKTFAKMLENIAKLSQYSKERKKTSRVGKIDQHGNFCTKFEISMKLFAFRKQNGMEWNK